MTHAEQEPTSADPDSDEEADLVLSLETETGLLTNQHTKGNWNSIGKWNNWWCILTLIEFPIFSLFFQISVVFCRPFNIIIETFYDYFLWVLHAIVFHNFCDKALLRLDVSVESSEEPPPRKGFLIWLFWEVKKPERLRINESQGLSACHFKQREKKNNKQWLSKFKVYKC